MDFDKQLTGTRPGLACPPNELVDVVEMLDVSNTALPKKGRGKRGHGIGGHVAPLKIARRDNMTSPNEPRAGSSCAAAVDEPTAPPASVYTELREPNSLARIAEAYKDMDEASEDEREDWSCVFAGLGLDDSSDSLSEEGDESGLGFTSSFSSLEPPSDDEEKAKEDAEKKIRIRQSKKTIFGRQRHSV